MTLSEIFADDWANSVFDPEEFGELHTIDGTELLAVVVQDDWMNTKNSYGHTKNAVNPKESAVNKTVTDIYFMADSLSRNKFTANSMINVDGKKLFVHTSALNYGVQHLTVGTYQV